MFQNLPPRNRFNLAQLEVYKVRPCFLVQFVGESTEHGHIAVEVCFHHVLEDVAHLVVSALLLHCLASSLCHVGRD